MYKIAFLGGHFTTALAVIEEIIADQKIKSEEIVFFGRQKEGGKISSEYQEVSLMGNIKFVNVKAYKLNRYFSFSNVISIFFFPISLAQAIVNLIKYNPKIIVGFGGYISFPYCLAGKLLMKKVIIHEGTVRGGVANRILSRIVDKSFISFETSGKYIHNAILLGFPIRKSIRLSEKHSGKIPIILISGGHLGSKAINSCVKQIIPELLKKYLVVHQVGVYDYEKFVEFKKQLPSDLRLKYVMKIFFTTEEYSTNLTNASVVISRSGINTVCEVLYKKIPAIFIPLPFSQKNEQFENAKIPAGIGLAKIIEQKDLKSDVLLEEINNMMNIDTTKIDNMFYHDMMQNATTKFADCLYEFSQ